MTPSPRQVLKRQTDRLAERGLVALAGTELEFIVFRDTYDDAWRKAYRDMTPANLYNVDYSMLGTGRPIDISQKTSAFPVARISRDAGMYLHWSGDSSRIYWTLGPELFTRSLSETFAFVEGAPPKILGATATVTDIDSQNFAGGRFIARISAGVEIKDRLIRVICTGGDHRLGVLQLDHVERPEPAPEQPCPGPRATRAREP